MRGRLSSESASLVKPQRRMSSTSPRRHDADEGGVFILIGAIVLAAVLAGGLGWKFGASREPRAPAIQPTSPVGSPGVAPKTQGAAAPVVPSEPTSPAASAVSPSQPLASAAPPVASESVKKPPAAVVAGPSQKPAPSAPPAALPRAQGRDPPGCDPSRRRAPRDIRTGARGEQSTPGRTGGRRPPTHCTGASGRGARGGSAGSRRSNECGGRTRNQRGRDDTCGTQDGARGLRKAGPGCVVAMHGARVREATLSRPSAVRRGVEYETPARARLGSTAPNGGFAPRR